MKKLFLRIAAIALIVASCGENKTNADTNKTDAPAVTQTEKKDTATTPVATPAATETASSDVPKFSSPEVQQLANDYSTYIQESIAAAKSGDSKKMQEIAMKGQEWATKTQAAAAKMTPEDGKLWAAYAQKLATQLTGQ